MPRPQPLFRLHRLFAQSSHGVSPRRILNTLRISRPTAFRLLKELRESFAAPIEYDRQTKTYRYAPGTVIELPSSWLNHEEWTLVLGLVQSLSKGEKGPLSPLMTSLKEKLALWSAQLGEDATQWGDKIRFVPMGERRVGEGILQTVLSALNSKSRISIQYLSALSEDGGTTQRVISPITLVRYRDNWYIDAFCHLRAGLRSFSLSQILSAQILEEPSIPVDRDESDRFFSESYGIFSGSPKHVAKLVFKGPVAKLVSRESWHPQQTAEWLQDGHWRIRFPFNDFRELVRDICRWSDGLVSIDPPVLRSAVIESMTRGLKSLKVAPGANLAPGGRRGPRSGRPSGRRTHRG